MCVNREVWLNGSFLPETDARIGIDDGGWLHGAGLFETMWAESGRVFRLEAHLGRLLRSAEKLLSVVALDSLPGRAQFEELLARNELTDARLRLTVTAGSMREDVEAQRRPLSVCLTAFPAATYPARFYEEGVAVVVSPYRQCTSDPTAGHKTVCYLPRLLALRDARRAGCEEALWFTEFNHLAEGSISNVFIVRDSVLKTPALETPVLPGIARSAVLELAQARGMRTDFAPLTIDDLLDADEVFLTNVAMQVMPVVRVEQRDIKESKVGPVTRELLGSFRELVRKECNEDGKA